MEMVNIVNSFIDSYLKNDTIIGDEDGVQLTKNRIIIIQCYDKSAGVLVHLTIHFHPIGSDQECQKCYCKDIYWKIVPCPYKGV